MIKCEGCGGALKFDIPSQKMRCDSCREIYEVSDIEEVNNAETMDMSLYTCPECGGEIYADEQTVQGFCSYCGASTTLEQKMVEWKKPKMIVPFGITKDDAKQAFADKMKKSLFTPNELKDPEYIDTYRGIYMPYWVYNTYTKGHINREYAKSKGEYTYYHKLKGDASLRTIGFSHDASSTFADDIGDGVVPYDLKQAKEFQTGYMSGFYADVADIEAVQYNDEIEKKNLQYINNKVNATARKQDIGSRVASFDMLDKEFISCVEETSSFMLPVWFMSYRKRNRVCYAAINGQTGRLISDIPVDLTKFSIVSLVIAIVAFLVLNFFFTFTPGKGCIIMGIMTVLMSAVYATTVHNISKKNLSDEEKMQGKRASGFSMTTLIGVLIGIIVAAAGFLDVSAIIINRNDGIYYGMMILCMGLSIYMMSRVLIAFNKMTTRKLPQYSYKGGNTNA